MEVNVMESGQTFGEQALESGEMIRGGTIQVKSETAVVLSLDRESFQRVVGNNLMDIINTNVLTSAIKLKLESLDQISKNKKL